jgi:phage tail-like protein
MKPRTLLAALLGGVVLIAGTFGAWTASSQGAAAPGDNPNDPITAARFELSIDGHSIAIFSELEGIVSGYDRDELEVRTRRRGDPELKIPAKRMPQTVTLKRGMTRNIQLAAWHELVILGDVAAARKNVSLTMYNTTGNPVARYHLTNAWPSKLEIDALKAGASEVLYETVTLSAEFIQRVSV